MGTTRSLSFFAGLFAFGGLEEDVVRALAVKWRTGSKPNLGSIHRVSHSSRWNTCTRTLFSNMPPALCDTASRYDRALWRCRRRTRSGPAARSSSSRVATRASTCSASAQRVLTSRRKKKKKTKSSTTASVQSGASSSGAAPAEREATPGEEARPAPSASGTTKAERHFHEVQRKRVCTHGRQQYERC